MTKESDDKVIEIAMVKLRSKVEDPEAYSEIDVRFDGKSKTYYVRFQKPNTLGGYIIFQVDLEKEKVVNTTYGK